MTDYKRYLDKISSELEELEEIKELNNLLVQENIRLRKELKKMGHIEYPNPELVNEVEISEIFNLKNVGITDRELLPRGTVRVQNFICKNYLNSVFPRNNGRIKCSKFSNMLMDRKLYDASKFFKGSESGNERLAALCIVLCEHYYGIKFELPEKDKLVWGTRNAYKLRWFSKVLDYVKIYRERLIFNE